MKLRSLRVFFLLLGLSILTPWHAMSQQVSGSISGTITDAQQGVIPGAKVTLVDTLKASTRELYTDQTGSFVFTPLQPSSFDLSVESEGFRTYEQTGIKVFASDRIVLPAIELTIGSVAETVTVEGYVIPIQTKGADRSGILTGNQVLNLAIRNRSFFALAATIPGVTMNGTGLGNIFVNGNRGNQNNLTIDGITNVDTGSNGGPLVTLNIDQIAEFKLTTNSQPAEMGRSSGAAIQVITRSGTPEFHGTGYWFHRHESLNANNWRNNLEGRERQLLRFNQAGFNVGGPVYIPGKFNKNKDKAFFFFSNEWQRQLSPNGLRSVLVPTEAERIGDFSGTVESSGAPVIINNPLDNGNPFLNNQVPQSQISSDGQKILNFYPTPNAAGQDPSFNFQTQVSDSFPRRETLARGDYNFSDKWRLNGRWLRATSEQDKAYGQWNADYNIPFAPMNFGNPGWSLGTNLTTIISPTLTNEFVFGTSKNVLNIDPVDDTFDRSKLNLSYQMPFANADPQGLIQNWRFNVPNAPFTSFNGTPFRNFNHTYDFTDNISKVFSGHIVKAGLYVHYSQKDQTAFTSVNGDIWFDRDSQNPGDTNWAFSNALLGNFRKLEQSDGVLNGEYRSTNVEWYIQDSWKVRSNLTIDLGIRFYYIQPQFDQALQTSSFNPGIFDTSASANLWQPINDSQGNVVARNPLTGEFGPRAFIGAVIDTSGPEFVNGLFVNGIGRAGQNFPKGLIDGQGILYAPRLGIAWSITPKTVIRTGGGVFYDRFQGNPVFDMLANPPSTVRPTLFFGNLAEIGNSQGVFFPNNVEGFDKGGEIPTTYNWNFSIQRQLPGLILLDVGYVGMKSNHNLARQDYNQTPFGSAWLPENQDPTIANPKFDGTTTKQINLYRPFSGFARSRLTFFGADSNYHSLQISANRRMGKAFLFGAAYTWSKSLGTASGDRDSVHPTNFKSANYGPTSFQRSHNFVLNYTWELPKVTQHNGLGYALNGWIISGITTFQTGQWDNINFSIEGLGGTALNRKFTGSETTGPRVVITDDPNGRGEIDAWINPLVFALPQVGSTGNDSATRPVERPGINNWDISIFKEIPMGSESRYLQLRFEFFNAFNHAQFSDFNRNVQFDPQGNITNLPTALGGSGGRFGFGAITSARDPRIIQLALKFYF